MTTAARALYAIALGLFVAMTVGFGLVTFFPDPKPPEFPTGPRAAPVGAPASTPAAVAQQEQAQQDYDRAQRTWQQDRRAHRRVALAIVTALALACVVAGVVLARAADVLTIGLMIGGLLTLLWGLAYAASDAGSGTMFVAALIALLVLLSLGVGGVRRRLVRALLRTEGRDVLG